MIRADDGEHGAQETKPKTRMTHELFCVSGDITTHHTLDAAAWNNEQSVYCFAFRRFGFGAAETKFIAAKK